MPEKYKDLIDVNDFKSVQLLVTLVNLTTNTEIGGGQRKVKGSLPKKGKDHEVVFLEFVGEEGLALEVPPHSGARGHQLLVKVTSTGGKYTVNFEGKSRITDVSSIEGSDKFRVELELDDYDHFEWEQLRNLFSDRQKEIEEFFTAVRGY